jgi:hypothetical protein
MKRNSVISRSAQASGWATLILFILVMAGLPLAAQDYKFTISTAQPWTDTGVDLQPDDVLTITAAPSALASAGCAPAGIASPSTPARNLPVPTAPPGALIARLQENAPAVLVGAGQQLRVAHAGHLFLGMNALGTVPCPGGFAVKVHMTSNPPAANAAPQTAPSAGESLADNASHPASANAANGTSATTSAQAKAGGGESDVKDIKGALTTAAQIWLSGQFGTTAAANSQPAAPTASSATPGSTPATAKVAPVAPVLTLSSSPLAAQLRKSIDRLPRRVNDQFQSPGDMVNVVVVGPLQKVQDALTAADWQVADRDVKESVMKAVLETYEKRAYLAMPMSELYLFGRVQDYGYEQAEPYAVVASRHHFRIWKAPFQWNGQDVWAIAGTHDIGFEKDQRNGKVTHKIDPAVDGERDNIGATLQKSSKVKSLTYYLPPDPVQDARNATGGGYHSDGRILVVTLQ